GGSTLTITLTDAVAPATGGAQTWQATARSSAGGTLAALGASPSITVFSADGSGTLTTPTGTVSNSSSANTLVFTYTAAAGGMDDGVVRVTVPAGWTAPTTTGGANGEVTASTGTVGVSGRDVTVSGVTLAAGATLTVTYANGTAPATGGTQTWTAAHRATSGGAVTGLASSPQVYVTYKPDVPVLQTPSASAWVTTTTPDLTARFEDDDVLDTGKVDFRVCSDTLCTTVLSTFSSVSGIANPADASASVPGAAGLADGGTYYWQARAEDGTGLRSAWSTSRTFSVDVTAPTQLLSLTSASPAGALHRNGTDVWYRGVDAGSVRLSTTVSDAGSGPASGQFAALGGTTAGWSFAPATVSTPAGGPFESAAYAWSAGTTAEPAAQVTGRDAAGNTVSTTLTFRSDSAAPTGSITAPGALQFVGGSSVAVSSDSADLGSGVAEAEFFACAGAACDPFADGASIGSDADAAGGWTAVWNTSALADGAYRLAVRTTDEVGNVFESAPRQVAVDNTAPAQALEIAGSTAVFQNGNTIFYRGSKPGGDSFTIRSTPDDGTGSGAQSTTFGALGGGSAGFTFTGSTETVPAGGPFVSGSVAWSQGASSAPTIAVSSADLVGNSTTPPVTLTLTNDSTAPTGDVTAPLAGADVRGTSVAVTSDSADGTGSGVAQVQFEWSDDGSTWNAIGAADTTAPYAATWDSAAAGDGAKLLRAVTTDNVGNVLTGATVAVTADNTAPTQTVAVTNVSQAGGNASAFQNGTTVWYRGSAGGSFTVATTVSDITSGAGSATTAALGGDPTGWTHAAGTVSTPAGGPFESAAFTWAAGASGTATAVVTGADLAGNPVTTPTTLSFVNDSTAPTGDLTAPLDDAFVRGNGIAVTAGSADAGSGVKSALFEIKPVAGSFTTLCTDTDGADGYGCTLDTLPLTDGPHVLRVTTTDRVGNTYSHEVDITVDNASPTQALSVTDASPAGSVHQDGTTVYYRGSVAGSVEVRSTVTDANPASAEFAALGGSTGGWTSGAALPATATTPAGGPFDSPTLSWAAGTTSAPTVGVTAADRSGNLSAAATLTFANDSTPPALTVACAPACLGSGGTYTTTPVQLTLSAPDAGAGLREIRYTTDGTDPSPSNGTIYSGPITISAQGTTTVKYEAYDRVGNATGDQSEVVSIDSNAPTLVSSNLVSSGDAVQLHFSEPLDGASVPAAGAFAVSVNGPAVGVDSVTVTGAVVTLAIDVTVDQHDTVLFSYTV
ncbi:MAG TPA: Ig-like domain-containing protein, partial [Actinomycetota bacterium]